MATSTQRLLILVLALNLIFTISFAIYQAPRTIDYGVFDGTIELGDSSATTLEGESASVSPENLQEEGSFGSSLRMGRTIFNLFIRGLVSLPVDEGTYRDPLTKIAVYISNILRGLLGLLLIIELYFIYKNKKNT